MLCKDFKPCIENADIFTTQYFTWGEIFRISMAGVAREGFFIGDGCGIQTALISSAKIISILAPEVLPFESVGYLSGCI
jgi:hypothetical protein